MTPRNALLARWQQFAAELRHPAVELTAEEFAPVLATFRGLCAIGHRFDATIVALMDILDAQMRGGEDDEDADGADALLDLDSADDDYEAWVSADDDLRFAYPPGSHAWPRQEPTALQAGRRMDVAEMLAIPGHSRSAAREKGRTDQGVVFPDRAAP